MEKTTLSLRHVPVETFNKITKVNFSAIEERISDPHIMNNIQVYFNMEYYSFTNELANSDLEIVGWEYKSGDKTLIINFDYENCAGYIYLDQKG